MFEMIQEPDRGSSISKVLVHVLVPGEPDAESKDGLSERGRSQVFELARSRLLAAPAKIYSSKSKDCVTTADILVKELFSSLSIRDCLDEVDLDAKALDDAFLRNEMPKIWDDFDYSYGSGESLQTGRARISSCINALVKLHPDSTIGVVLPPIASVLFYRLVVGGSPQIEDWLYLGFASCTTYEYSKNGWTLVMPPENSFLTEPSTVIDILPSGIF